MREARAEQIRFGLFAVSALTTLGMLLAFGPALRELEPEGLATAFSLGRMALQGFVCFGIGAATAWACSHSALAALRDADGDAAAGLDAANRFPTRFTIASFAAWMLCASIGLILEPAPVAAAVDLSARLLAFAAVGVVAASANAMLSARAIAPVADALAARTPAQRREKLARPLSLAWKLRLLVAALVLAPALLDARSLSVVSLALLVIGLALAEVAISAVRDGAASLRDAARSAVKRDGERVAGSAEFAEVFDALAGLTSAIRAAIGTFEGAATELGAGLGELDTTRESVSQLTVAQVADVQQLTQLMNSVYSQAENINRSLEELRTAVDDSSSAVTELGAAGEQLAGTAGDLRSRADTVSTSIQRALASLGEVATSTDVLAGVASDASSSMEEMATSMRDVNENAERCADLSDQVVGVADQGSQVVQQTIDGMQAIREATATAERVIRGLGDRAGEIGAIVGVIDGVANETSLLALNAAIIAAQAGEHGRGFSVVAGEIRQLATRVSASTAEITNLIRSVQDESTNAIGAIERGAKSVANGVELSEQAGRSLIEITRVARSNKKLVEGIVHSVSEQTKAAAHVVGVIEEVNSQAERIRQAAREQAQGNDLVLEQAQAMKEMAQQVHHTADEQSRGTRLIVETVESIVSGLDKIGVFVKEQSAGCARVVACTWEAYKRAKETSESAGRLDSVADRLRAGVSAVRDLVASFRS